MTPTAPDNRPRSNLNIASIHWRQAVFFGMIWATFLATHAATKMLWNGWQDIQSVQTLTILIYIGAFVGGSMGWFASIWFCAHRIAPKRFATSLVLILICTIGITAILFALQYRVYYSQWHMPVFSIGWFFQVFFTGLSALYLFAVQGLRLLLPFSPLGLVAAALIFVKVAPKN